MAPPDLLILTDHRRWNEPDYYDVGGYCQEQGIPLRDLCGMDPAALHAELDHPPHRTPAEWKRLFAPYEVISFAVIFVVLRTRKHHTEDRNAELCAGYPMASLIRYLREQGKTVYLIGRESYGTERQIRLLKNAGLYEEGHFLLRKGKDLGFAALQEKHPESRKLHVGIGIVEDGMIPRYYGFDTCLENQEMQKSEPLPEVQETGAVYADKEEVRRLLAAHEVVSFDLFDTLLKRDTLSPEDVFALLEAREQIKDFRKNRIAALRSVTPAGAPASLPRQPG